MKRSPLKRSSPLRATGPARLTIKLRKCAVKACRQPFVPRSMTHKACGPECAQVIAQADAQKKSLRAAIDDRKQTRAQLEALKTVPKLKKEAQAEFNRYVRLRDAKLPCISCGAPPPDLSGLHAGRDAGHYRSTGSADHMRYVEDNCHAQCVKCNQYGAGMAVEYRIGLMARIGQARLDALETNRQAVKWTRDGLRGTRDAYRARANSLAKAA